jgi:hypothetical protein
MSKIILELDNAEATNVLKALALYVEFRKHYGVTCVVKGLVGRLQALAVPTFSWEENAFEKLRYPVKKVTVSLYEENPKAKP